MAVVNNIKEIREQRGIYQDDVCILPSFFLFGFYGTFNIISLPTCLHN